MVIFFQSITLPSIFSAGPMGFAPWPPKPAYSPETMVPKSLPHFCRHGSGIELLLRVVAATGPWTVG